MLVWGEGKHISLSPSTQREPKEMHPSQRKSQRQGKAEYPEFLQVELWRGPPMSSQAGAYGMGSPGLLAPNPAWHWGLQVLGDLPPD